MIAQQTLTGLEIPAPQIKEYKPGSPFARLRQISRVGEWRRRTGKPGKKLEATLHATLPNASRVVLAKVIIAELTLRYDCPKSYLDVLYALISRHLGWHSNIAWASLKRLASLASEVGPCCAKTAGRAMDFWCKQDMVRKITDVKEQLRGPGEQDYIARGKEKEGDGPVNHYDLGRLATIISPEMIDLLTVTRDTTDIPAPAATPHIAGSTADPASCGPIGPGAAAAPPRKKDECDIPNPFDEPDPIILPEPSRETHQSIREKSALKNPNTDTPAPPGPALSVTTSHHAPDFPLCNVGISIGSEGAQAPPSGGERVSGFQRPKMSPIDHSGNGDARPPKNTTVNQASKGGSVSAQASKQKQATKAARTTAAAPSKPQTAPVPSVSATPDSAEIMAHPTFQALRRVGANARNKPGDKIGIDTPLLLKMWRTPNYGEPWLRALWLYGQETGIRDDEVKRARWYVAVWKVWQRGQGSWPTWMVPVIRRDQEAREISRAARDMEQMEQMEPRDADARRIVVAPSGPEPTETAAPTTIPMVDPSTLPPLPGYAEKAEKAERAAEEKPKTLRLPYQEPPKPTKPAPVVCDVAEPLQPIWDAFLSEMRRHYPRVGFQTNLDAVTSAECSQSPRGYTVSLIVPNSFAQTGLTKRAKPEDALTIRDRMEEVLTTLLASTLSPGQVVRVEVRLDAAAQAKEDARSNGSSGISGSTGKLKNRSVSSLLAMLEPKQESKQDSTGDTP